MTPGSDSCKQLLPITDENVAVVQISQKCPTFFRAHCFVRAHQNIRPLQSYCFEWISFKELDRDALIKVDTKIQDKQFY